MRKYLNRTSSLGAALLGVITAACAAGCADETGITKEPIDSQQQAFITPTLLGVNGCTATAQFDIFSNLANAANWIAIDQSDVRNLTTQLQAYDQNNQLVTVQQSLVEANQAITSMINQTTNHMSASQISQLAQNQYVARTATTSVEENMDHADTAIARQASTSQASQAQSSAFNATQASTRNGYANTNQIVSANQFANDNARQAASAFGNDVNGFNALNNAFGLAALGVGAFNSAFGLNQNAVANDAFASSNNSRASSVFNSANTGQSFSDSLFANQFANQASQASQVASQASETAVANRASRSAAATTFDTYNQAISAFDQGIANQAASSLVSNQATTSQYQTVAYNNLQSLQSNHYVLNVQFQAAAQQALLRVFQGNNNAILSSADLRAMFNQCVF